jgi:hypothetical protein
MGFAPWQGAFRNITNATRRGRAGGIATRKTHPKPGGPDAPHGRGRRFREEREKSFEPVIVSYLLAAALTLLFFVTPHSLVSLVATVVATVASIPILISNYSIVEKTLWLLPLVIPATILVVLQPEASGWRALS